MSPKPFFSVVVPLYNKQGTIARCIESVLQQSFIDFEIIVVDDGSLDQSPEIVREFRDARIRMISQHNSGVSAARNKGVLEANGGWVAFIDADDQWCPEFLLLCFDSIRRFPSAGVVYGHVAWMRQGSELNKRGGEPQGLIGIFLKDYLHSVVYSGICEIHSSSVAVRADVFQSAGLFPVGIKVGEDSDQWLRLAWVTNIVYIPQTVAIYHLDDGTSGWETQNFCEPYWVSTYKSWLNERRIPRRMRRSSESYFQRYLIGKSFILSRKGKRLAALKILFFQVNLIRAPKMYLVKALIHWIKPQL